jgi:hypothetical protein
MNDSFTLAPLAKLAQASATQQEHLSEDERNQALKNNQYQARNLQGCKKAGPLFDGDHCGGNTSPLTPQSIRLDKQ